MDWIGLDGWLEYIGWIFRDLDEIQYMIHDLQVDVLVMFKGWIV